MSENMIRLPARLYEAVRRRAVAEEKTAEALVVEWVADRVGEVSGQTGKLDALQYEMAAFERLERDLRQDYDGQYVAIYQGAVVGSGADKLALLHEVYERFGRVSCYIQRVGAGVRTVRMPSIRVIGQ